jgi:transposase-like protein
MKQKRHTPEQIVGMLRQGAAKMASGQGIGQVCKAFGVSEATYYRWQKSYGSMPVNQVKRLKHLEKENSRLKQVVADLTLDKAILQEAFRGNC